MEEKDQKERICREILGALPDWFGIPESVEEYAKNCRELPVWAAEAEDGPVGFIAYRPTSAQAGEIYVMGVLPDCRLCQGERVQVSDGKDRAVRPV